MSAALRLTNLRKRYGLRGDWALDGLTAEFPTGSIIGVIGPNGAGKTTLFSVVCGYLPQDEGQVDILGGGPFDPWRLKGRLGVLPQDAALNDRSTCRQFLEFMGRLQGMGSARAKACADQELEALDLLSRGDSLIGALSHGMRRRLATASAMLGQPELVLLDEPTAGLDPAQAHRLRERLLQRRGQSTLVVSSHNLAELERICDHVVLVDKGRCTWQGSVDALTQRAQLLRWELAPGEPDLDALQRALPGQTLEWQADPEGGALVQRVPLDSDADQAALQLMAALVDQGLAVRGMRRGETLEDRVLGG